MQHGEELASSELMAIFIRKKIISGKSIKQAIFNKTSMTSCVPQKLCRRLFLLSLLSTFGKSNLIENRDKSKPEPLEVHCWNIHSLAMKTRTKKRFGSLNSQTFIGSFPVPTVHCVGKLGVQERLLFAWNFRVGLLGQMEQFISSGKNGSKYDAVPFVKNDPVELG